VLLSEQSKIADVKDISPQHGGVLVKVFN